MSVIAFVFSGQGAQRRGMGLDFAAADPGIARLFHMAETLRPGTLDNLKSEDPGVLKTTENTQPCLYLADLAAAIYLQNLGICPLALAGFSLGELPALAFGGAFSREDGFRIVCRRGELMGREAKKCDAGMAAVLRLENGTVEAICREHGVYPVNYNSPGQLVVSGEKAALATATEAFKAAGGRVMPLAVSGAFHSPYMSKAAEDFGSYLSDKSSVTPIIPVYANVTARPYSAPPHLTLASQIDHPVLWEQTVREMSRSGVDTFIEVGVGSTLAKLISKTLPGAAVYSVESPEGAKAVAREVAG